MTQSVLKPAKPSPRPGSSSFRRRVVAFALVLAALTLLIVVIDTNIWLEQAHIQEGFLAIKAEKFYFGVKFRGGVRNLDNTVLDYYLTGNAVDLATFRKEAEVLHGWLATRKDRLVDSREAEAFQNLTNSFGQYLAQIRPLLDANESPATAPQHFTATYQQVRQSAQPLLAACSQMVTAEHESFDSFLQRSDDALIWLQRLFLLSLFLLAALAGSFAVLVYRGLIAPLHVRLSESQALLERQEKLASLGALAAGVAHEIRNPLTAIKFRLFSLKKSLPPSFADHEDARVISEEINRLDRIVKDFLQFARPSEPRLVRVPAERILKDVVELMKVELQRSGIELKVDVRQPADINVDTQQLKQVLINLVQNSAESIQNNGSITLRLTRHADNANGKTGPLAVLGVVDTGKGIAPEVQQRLFDPFFTTKDGGTGLGLAIAARIVERHGGTIQYRTEPNRGTTFEVLLPAFDHDPGASSAN